MTVLFVNINAVNPFRKKMYMAEKLKDHTHEHSRKYNKYSLILIEIHIIHIKHINVNCM